MADQCCPSCGQPLPIAADRAAEALTLMRAGCAIMGIVPTWDDHVSERDAARLLNRSPSTLKNRRGLDAPLPYRRSGNRIEYALADLCRWGEKIDG